MPAMWNSSWAFLLSRTMHQRSDVSLVRKTSPFSLPPMESESSLQLELSEQPNAAAPLFRQPAALLQLLQVLRCFRQEPVAERHDLRQVRRRLRSYDPVGLRQR